MTECEDKITKTISDNTFMDGLFEWMVDNKMSDEEMSAIQHMFDHQQYDSDAVEMDIFNTDNKLSNIRQWLNNKTVSNLFQQYFEKIKRMFFFSHFLIFSFYILFYILLFNK